MQYFWCKDWYWCFFNWILLYKRYFFDCDLFWKSQSLLYGEEQVWILMWVKRLKLLSTFSQFRFWLSPKRVFFFQSCATSWNFSIGSLMEDCSLVATKEKHFGRQEFTMSIASFGGIGKSEFQIKDRSLWLCNQVCLLECSRFCWHSDGTNQNWVDLEQTEFEYRDIVHNIKTFLGNFRV